MTRSLFYREKTGPGAWGRATGTPPFVLSGLTGGIVYEIDIGDGVLLERTPAVEAVNLIVNGTFGVDDSTWFQGQGWDVDEANNLATRSGASISGNLDQTLAGGTLAPGNYRLTYTLSNFAGGTMNPFLIGGSATSFTVRSANGTYVETKTVSQPNNVMRFSGYLNFAGSLSNVILEGPL